MCPKSKQLGKIIKKLSRPISLFSELPEPNRERNRFKSVLKRQGGVIKGQYGKI